LGHAIEKVSGFRLKHGEAVAIGTVHAARLASRMGITVDPGLSQAIERTLGGLGLPVTIPEGLDRNSILQAMSFDKKKAGGMIRWVLPVRIGEVQIGVPVADPWLTEDSN
jgi:3-dehydroquinate synthetase